MLRTSVSWRSILTEEFRSCVRTMTACDVQRIGSVRQWVKGGVREQVDVGKAMRVMATPFT